ncbi:trypsin-like peptidase domain-containing protein [Paenibacillus sediminis]|uniref:Serine protease Do n=1 Tax=Paenibacillus sediminis TaxID=664909 RepID=A0ABS4H257_9BACL|nr:serine protease Do [Paenibacillus sediminis]
MRTVAKKAVMTLIAIALSVSGGISAAAESAGTALKAKVINGEVYVKAADAVQALGGQGTYDSSTGTYKVIAQDPVPQVVKNVSPSVVGIIGKPVDSSDEQSNRYDLAHGTGVIIKSDGWIVTNAHVIDGLSNTIVVTSDGKTYQITKAYSDTVSDLAIIKINAKNLKPAKFVSSIDQVQVGEKVIAIGTPISFSLRNSATVGVISGLNRALDASYKLIQTDTAINPGNSGGPLVNLKGEVVGINTMKYSAVGIDNLGFSIPANTVQYVINQYFKYGEVKRASLGLGLEESWSALVGLPNADPMTISDVNSSEAQKAGITEGDVLYSIDGKSVTSVVDVNELLKGYLPGQKVKLVIESGGDIVTRSLTLVQDHSSSQDK